MNPTVITWDSSRTVVVIKLPRTSALHRSRAWHGGVEAWHTTAKAWLDFLILACRHWKTFWYSDEFESEMHYRARSSQANRSDATQMILTWNTHAQFIRSSTGRTRARQRQQTPEYLKKWGNENTQETFTRKAEFPQVGLSSECLSTLKMMSQIKTVEAQFNPSAWLSDFRLNVQEKFKTSDSPNTSS